MKKPVTGPFDAIPDNYADDNTWVVVDGVSVTVFEGLTEDEARAQAEQLAKEYPVVNDD